MAELLNDIKHYKSSDHKVEFSSDFNILLLPELMPKQPNNVTQIMTSEPIITLFDNSADTLKKTSVPLFTLYYKHIIIIMKRNFTCF